MDLADADERMKQLDVGFVVPPSGAVRVREAERDRDGHAPPKERKFARDGRERARAAIPTGAAHRIARGLCARSYTHDEKFDTTRAVPRIRRRTVSRSPFSWRKKVSKI